MAMFKDSRIYVAGHTGLLGSTILTKLKSGGYSSIITRVHAELDLTDRESVNSFFKKKMPEYVFLCAGLTGGIIANRDYPAAFFHTNIAIQDNVFEVSHMHDVRNLIFYGSSCIYPKDCQQPIKEEYLLTGAIEETSQAYAAAKIAGIFACQAYSSQFCKNRFIALVPNSMYGPRDNFDLNNAHVLSALLRKFHEAKQKKKKKIILWGSGNPRREFIFSEDVAEASIFAMNNVDKLKNTHYNLGVGIDYSIRELADIVAKVVGYDGKIGWDRSKPNGVSRKLLDSSKFVNMGWRPRVNLEAGIRATYTWYLKNEI